MTNTKIISININSITETNDNGNEIQYKHQQCGGWKLFITPSAVYRLRYDRLNYWISVRLLL